MVPIAESLARYVVSLVRATRPKIDSAPDFVKKYVNYGGSIRAAQFIVLAAKARALSRKRYHVTYDDITSVIVPVLRHRILLELPCRVRFHRHRRNSQPPGGPRCRGRRRLDAAIPRTRGAGRHLVAGPGGEDGGGRLCRRPAPFARLRLQPGVRRVPRLHAGRRSAPRGLESLRAHGALLPEALSRRDQQPAHGAAGREQLDGVHVRAPEENGLRALRCGVAFLSRHSQPARCRGPDRLR